jgi:eukaryotic-like serine/threonine-protein kinase
MRFGAKPGGVENAVPSRVRFGGFELNLATGELCPAGQSGGNGKVLLREQPFQILRMLVERSGKIVTREEIRRKLWPNDTLVNFNHSINVAIGILRRELGDTAENPQYIETLARRGYRLLVTTELLQTRPGVPPGENTTKKESSSPGDITGKRVSHYRVLEIIGGGGMGMVYKAEDLRLGRRVALKFLPEEFADDPTALRRFEREAQTASALNHPNICTIYDIEENGGHPFIAMELLEGASLNHYLETSSPKTIPLSQLLEIALQICDGLQAAHEKGIIHRDIKPANIFLTKQGPVKILDFGLAKLAAHEEPTETARAPMSDGRPSQESTAAVRPKAIHSNLTLTGVAMGTAGYMSPEQVRKEKLDATTDLFSFGLVLYEVATGRRAFTGETTTAVHDAILHDTQAPAHQLNPACPRKLDAVIARALEKDRTKRYQSAAEMRRALERVGTETLSAQRNKRAWLAGGALLLVALSGVGIYQRLYPAIKLSRTDTLVLAVTNETGDRVFDDAVYTGVFFDLQQTPYIHVLETDKYRTALWELHIPDDAGKTPQVGRQVCLHTNSRMVVATSISDEGNGFRIEMQGIDCQSGRTILRVREDALSRARVIHVIGLAATQLRHKLGEPASSISRFNKPLDEAMSPSPEAIQLLTEGYRHTLTIDFPAAISDYQRAIALDSKLAMAYAPLGSIQGSVLGEHALAVGTITKAFGLRERVTEPVRFQREDLYYDVVTGEQEKACSVSAQWVQLFPDDFIGHNNFARCLLLLGRQDQSLAEAREAARQFPSPWSYAGLILRSILTDRFEEAKTAFDDAEVRKFDGPDLHEKRALLAFLQKDEPEMQKQWNWAVGKPHTDHFMLDIRGQGEAYHGRYRNYARFSGQAMAMARKDGDLSAVATYENEVALQEAEVGNPAQAGQLARKSLAGARNLDKQINAAFAFARAGDIAQAQKLVDEINQEAPLNSVIQSYSLPTIRAAMKLETNDPVGAIDILRTTLQYENAYDLFFFNNLYPAYIRGQAYLQMSEGRLAVVEFKKLLDHPGIAGTSVIGALSHLQMARAQEMTGDKAAAQKSYEDFLILWKDADSDLPIYQQAKVEYARLRSNQIRVMP